jgi:asparagine synthase (glutamine-hydrolysing)
MFRAPFDSFHLDVAPPFVEQLLSPESLAKTHYFDAQQVAYWRKHFRSIRVNAGQRVSVEMGLVGVLATQLWHHSYIDSSLCELPSFAGSDRPSVAGNGVANRLHATHPVAMAEN